MTGRALVGAHVLPMTAPDAVSSAIAWQDGRILAVGDDASVKRTARAHGIEVEDARGKTVLPGFVDAHMHFLHVGIKRMRPDLRGARSLAEALERTAAWLHQHPGDGPVIAEGWDESAWPGGRGPTREDLDGLADRPLVLRRIDGHYAVANAAALPALRARFDRDDWVDTRTGVLLEDASLYLNEVMPASAQDLDTAVDIACDVAHSLGVTAVGDYSQAPFRAALQRAAAAARLHVRVASCIYVQQLEAEVAHGFRTGRRGAGPDDPHEATPEGGVRAPPGGGTSEFLRDGGLKVFHDGSFGGHTAWLHEPFEDRDTRGAPIWNDEEARAWYDKAHATGVQVHGHAIGDAAIDQALDCIEGVVGGGDGAQGPTTPPGTTPNPLRHRIEHFELPTPAAVARTARLGVVASCQPNFVAHWSATGGMYEKRLGARFLRNNRYHSWLAAGVETAFGSDGMPFGPLYGLQGAVFHPLPTERVPPAQAVWLYTARAAWSLHWEDSIGTLRPGMHADLLVLDLADLAAAPPQEWLVSETVSGGRTVYRGQDIVLHA